MPSKIFQDYKAKRKFVDFYEFLNSDIKKRAQFADAVRKAADEKMNSLDDNLTEFYLTEKDIIKIAEDCLVKNS